MLGLIISAISVAVSAAKIVTSVLVTLKTLQVGANILVGLCKQLGIIENKEIKEEELGEKALAAEAKGIRPEKFDKYEEYLREIEKFPVDEEMAKKWTKEEKLRKGAEVAIGGLVDKFGPSVENTIMEMVKRPDFFNGDRLKVYMEAASKSENDITKIGSYLDGDIKNLDQKKEINSYMLSLEKNLNPDMTERELQKIINSQK